VEEKTHFGFTPDSGRVLDLPHALSEASDANAAAAVLHLVPDVRDDVLRWEEPSEERLTTVRSVQLERDTADRSGAYVHLMGPEKEDGDSLLLPILWLTDLQTHRRITSCRYKAAARRCSPCVCVCVHVPWQASEGSPSSWRTPGRRV